MRSRVAASRPVRQELGVIWDAPFPLDPPPARSLAFALAPRVTAATVIAAMAVGGPGPAIAVGKDKPVNPVIALPPSAGGEVGADEGVAAPDEVTEEDEPDDDGNTAPPPSVEPEPPTVVDTGPEPAAAPEPPAAAPAPPTPEPPVAAAAPEPPAAAPAPPTPEPPVAAAAPEPPAAVPAPGPEPPVAAHAPAPPAPDAAVPAPAPPAAPAPAPIAAEEPAPPPARAEPAPPRTTDARAGTAPAAPTTRRTALQAARAADPVAVFTRAVAPGRSGTRLVVRRGDSLWLIAARLAGPGASDARVAGITSALWNLNAGRIGTRDPNLLPVGVTLDLPTL